MSRSKIIVGLFTAAVASQSTTSAPSAGQTLSNGAYVCNPAHSYPGGASCDGSTGVPTLVYPTTTGAPSAGQTLSNGAYVCNPAHSYPAGASCDGSGPTPTLIYASTTAAPSAGQTLSSGAYVCNPAHSYPAGASCDGSGPTPTLVYPATTAAPSAGQTLSNGAYVCNPAHSYPGATCIGTASPPTLSYYKTSTTSAPKAGETLSNGAYVCNPAHSYPAATCVGSPPTLSYYPTSSVPVAPKPAPTTMATVTVYACGPSSTPTKPAPTTSSQPAASTSSTKSAPPPAATTPTTNTGKQCPLTLAGTEYQFPHLIVTSMSNAQTSNTLYSPKIDSKTVSYFNFDIPASYAGKTCEVIFSLPRQDQLETSSFNLAGNGNLVFSSLSQVAKQSAAAPAVASKLGSWTPAPGTSFTVAKGACASNQAIGYSIAAEGDRSLTYFQDYNPCPIGLYIVAH